MSQKNISFFALAEVSILVLDQMTKWWMLNHPHFFGEQSDFFQLSLILNRGVVFGIPLNGVIWYVTLLIGVALLLFFLREYINFHEPEIFIALGLLSGGALGNLIDKIRFDAVVDFVKIGPWPLFNIADIAITASVAIFIIFQNRILIKVK